MKDIDKWLISELRKNLKVIEKINKESSEDTRGVENEERTDRHC